MAIGARKQCLSEGGDMGQGSSDGGVCGGDRGGGVQEGNCFAAGVWAVGDGGMGCEGGLTVQDEGGES